MKKQILSLLLTAVMLLGLCAAPVSAAKVGDPMGDVLYTDIVAYIDGHPIQSFNIGGNTYIVAEPLLLYGFGVIWDGDARQVIISKTRTASPENYTADYVPTSSAGKTGEVAMQYLYSDVVTLIGDKTVESFNIGGMTCISIDTLAAEFGYALTWDGDARTISMTTSGGSTADDSTASGGETGNTGSAYTAEQIAMMMAAEKFVSEYLTIEGGVAVDSYIPGDVVTELRALAGEGSDETVENMIFMLASLYDDYGFEVLGSHITDYGIGVDVRITMRDLSDVITNTVMVLMMQVSANPDMTEDEIMSLTMNTMFSEMSDETREIAAREVTVNIKVDADGSVSFVEDDNIDLLNALLGGLYEDPMLAALLG